MSWINDILNKIKPTTENPLVFNTAIGRSAAFDEVMQREHGRVVLFLDELLDHFNNNDMENFRSSGSLSAYSPYASGVVINKPEETSEETFTCVFDTLKKNTAVLGYRLSYQTCEVKVLENAEERKEVYYLKPQFRYQEGKRYEQKFGNVKIERNVINGQSRNIALLCTYYSGYNYSKPIAFEEFILALCQANND